MSYLLITVPNGAKFQLIIELTIFITRSAVLMEIQQAPQVILRAALALTIMASTAMVAFAQSAPLPSGEGLKIPEFPAVHADPNMDKEMRKWMVLPFAPGVPNPQPFSADVTRGRVPASVEQVLEQTLKVNPGTYVFATNNCYGLADANQHFRVYALRGSLYAVEGPFALKLARGRMLVIANDKAVKTSIGNNDITILPHGSAIVETGPAGSDLIRVFALTRANEKQDAAQVSFTTNIGNQTIISVTSGQELVVGGHNLSDNELKTTDGIARRPVTNATIPAQTRMFEFSLAQLADFDAIFACPRKLGQVGQKDSALKHLYHRMLEEAAKQEEFSATLADAKPGISVDATYESVSEQEKNLLASKAPPEECNMLISEKNRLVLAPSTTLFRVENDDTLVLESGSILANSKRPLNIKVANKTIQVSRGAIAYIKVDRGNLKVVNMSDLRTETVKIAAGPHVLHPKMGQEVLITQDIPSLSDVFDSYKVGHRISMIRQIPGFGWVSTSHVALGDVIATSPLVSALPQNQKSKYEKKLAWRIKKSAATLAEFNKNHGKLLYGEPEDETGATRRMADRCNHCLN